MKRSRGDPARAVRRWLTCSTFTLCLFSALAPEPARAHIFAPALLEIREGRAGLATVRFKQPVIRSRGSGLRPVLPDSCSVVGAPTTAQEGTGIVGKWSIRCAGSLVGETVGMEGIAGSGASVLLRIELADGRALREVLTPDNPAYVVPETQGALEIAADYTVLGSEHILGGWDHLLFVLGLVLLVGWGRKLLWTVTAFTVGHSMTLALATLGFVNVSPQPVEAAIAASIYFLAIELTRRHRARPSLMERAPWLVAGTFGLLHGLGFAGALSQLGLPPGEIPLALFSFNVGIELGQLAFVAVVLLGWWALRTLPVRWPDGSIYVPAYGIGSLAAFWVLERVVSILRWSV